MIGRALRESVLWVTVARVAGKGRAERDYRVLSVDGEALLEMRTHPWRREMVVTGASTEPVLVLRRRRSFPLTGKVDVLEGVSRRRIGIVTRSGRFVNGAGARAGWFRDARTLGARTRQALLIGGLEAVFGGDSGGVASGSEGYVYVAEGEAIGTLARSRPPFPRAGETAAPVGGRLRRLLPARMRDWLGGGPRAWKLERVAADPNEPLLVIGAALFAIELSHW